MNTNIITVHDAQYMRVTTNQDGSVVGVQDVYKDEIVAVTRDRVMELVHALLKAVDVDTERKHGALLSTIIKSAQARLDDPKNVAKGGWDNLTLDHCDTLVQDEIWEFFDAQADMDRSTEPATVAHVALEAGDVFTTLGMYLQKLEAEHA